MTYQEFLGRVQHQAGLSSPRESACVVTATLATLGEALAAGGVDGLPGEIRGLIAELLADGVAGQPWSTGAAGQGANPQLAGETRVESGGESTAESGQ